MEDAGHDPDLNLFFLVLGAIQDIKHRNVRNSITAIILFLSLVYFAMTPTLTWLHILVAIGILAAYIMKATGGADVKAGIPLIFTLNIVALYIFLIITVIVQGIMHYAIDKKTPGFVSMAVGYLIIILSGS